MGVLLRQYPGLGLESCVSGLWREPALWDGFFYIVRFFFAMIY